MYAWPSAQDIYSHRIQKTWQLIDRDAILAIGFMVEGKYYLQVIETHNDLTFKKLAKYANAPEKFGEFLNLLLNSKSKMAIIGENGQPIDYMQFFKNNKNQNSAYGIQITPSSCNKL